MIKVSSAIFMASTFIVALSSANVSAANDGYITLIPPIAVLPQMTPKSSLVANLVDLFEKMSPLLQELGVKNDLKTTSKDCLLKAGNDGQKGALIKYKVAYKYYGIEKISTVVGGGVQCVGNGSSALGVLLSTKGNVFGDSIPPGMFLDEDVSLYYWFERDRSGNKINVSTYDLMRMDSYVNVLAADEITFVSMMKVNQGAILKDYAQRLVDRSNSVSDQRLVLGMLETRAGAVDRLAAVERDLAVKLEKARNAERLSATWGTLSAVFSVASGVAIASAYLGVNVKTKTGGTPMTNEELSNSLESQVKAFGSNVDSLKGDINRYQILKQQSEDLIFKFGTEHVMPISNDNLQIIRRLY